MICGRGGAHSIVPLNGIVRASSISISSGLTGQLFGIGNKRCGASFSETSHCSSLALGSCFSLKRLMRDRATPSADMLLSLTLESVANLAARDSASENDAVDADMPPFLNLRSSSSSESSVDTLSEELPEDVDNGLTL